MAKKKTTQKTTTKAKTVQVSTPAEKPLTEPLVASQSNKIVTVEAMVGFWDIKEQCERGMGAMFEASEARAEELVKLGLVVVL